MEYKLWTINITSTHFFLKMHIHLCDQLAGMQKQIKHIIWDIEFHKQIVSTQEITDLRLKLDGKSAPDYYLLSLFFFALSTFQYM